MKARSSPCFSHASARLFVQPRYRSRLSGALESAKGVGTIVDLSLTDGAEVGRYTQLPAFGAIQFSATGWGLGTVRTGRIGDGVTKLTFLAPDASVAATDEVPDAVSEIAVGPDLWYVGCRDGCLYAYRNDGERAWQWEMPGSRTHQDAATTRQCPYHVASDGERAVVASMGDLFCVSSSGSTDWHFELPDTEATDQTVSIPLSEGLAGPQHELEIQCGR